MAAVLITTGPTREYLDDVRFLSNGSTGRMGNALARAALAAGHRVLLVSGPVPLPPPDGAELTAVESALEMAAAVDRLLDRADIVFAAAAVCDFRPAQRWPGKPPKPDGPMTLQLVPNPDIVAGVARRKGARAVVGFALEAAADGLDAALARGRAKLRAKGLDAIAVNLATALGEDESEVVLLYADGREQRLPRQPKDRTAAALVEAGLDLWRRSAPL